MSAERPMINTKFVSESVILITVYLDHLIPVKSSGDTQEAKNGNVDISVFKQSFNLEAEVHEDKKKTKKYKLNIVRLPSKIKDHSWKIEKGVVKITLIKAKEVSEDGTEAYVDWKPKVHLRGLDQYDSSEDEDGNVPEHAPLKLKSEQLTNMGFDVEMGKTQVFEVDAEDLKNLQL